MWIDSHCHVSSAKYHADRAEVLARARSGGVERLIDIGCELESWEGSLALARAEPDVSCALGLHPHEAKHWTDDARDRLRALYTENAELCAIGEMGLDYYYGHSPREAQIAAFHAQLELAEELGAPAIFHIRDAHEEAASILGEHPQVRGIVHCFTGGPAEAARYLELGHRISFSGIVTFKSAREIQAAALEVPLDQLLVETDAPYLAPVPKRGKRNEPGFVAHTGAFLAQLRGLPEAEFAAQTRANTHRAFALERTL